MGQGTESEGDEREGSTANAGSGQRSLREGVIRKTVAFVRRGATGPRKTS